MLSVHIGDRGSAAIGFRTRHGIEEGDDKEHCRHKQKAMTRPARLQKQATDEPDELE